MRNHVLAIDDDDGLLTLLTMGLEKEGFTVSTAKDGNQALQKAYQLHPDVILLDIGMPELDGWATCERLRLVTDTPIIILTAQSGRMNIVKGLSLGADDYVTKPCSFEELTARIKAVLRRAAPTRTARSDRILTDGDLYINLSESSVTLHGEPVNLTPTELRLLLHLARHEGQIVSHGEILTSVWGPEYEEETEYLAVYVHYIRQKIEAEPSNPRYIITKHHVGYALMLGNSPRPTV